MTALKKQPKWKQVQSKKKRKESKSKVVMGLTFLGLILLLIITSMLWKKAKLSVWNGKSRLAIVNNIGDTLSVLVLLPDQKRSVEFAIPNQTIINVPFGYGEYQAEKVFELGSLDNRGGKLLKRGTQDLMGIKITGYRHDDESNLTWLDKLRIRLFSWFSSKETTSYDLASSNSLGSIELSDGEKAYRPSRDLIDQLINMELFDQEIVDEGLSIAIVNGTEVVGMGQALSRLVANLGAEVRLVTNIENLDSSKVIVASKDLLKTKTVGNLVEMMEVNEAEVGDVSQYRSEVMVVIGQDYVSLK